MQSGAGIGLLKQFTTGAETKLSVIADNSNQERQFEVHSFTQNGLKGYMTAYDAKSGDYFLFSDCIFKTNDFRMTVEQVTFQ